MFTLANPFLTAWFCWTRPVFAAYGYSPTTLDRWQRAPALAALLEQDMLRKALSQK